jgi:ABC-type Mn2+/Zn2+ transport system ATPase subunit
MGGRYVHLGWLRRPVKRDRKGVEAALERLGLSGVAERRISHLSGGQRQRALLARSLAQEADLLLLDEPMTAVDSETRETISEVLRGLRERGKTVVVATHDLDRLSREFEGALYLRDGREAEPEPGGFVGLRVGAAWAG